MNVRAILVLTLVALAIGAAGMGCGGNDLTVVGVLPATPTASLTPTATCGEEGETCTVNSDCCRSCDVINNVCL